MSKFNNFFSNSKKLMALSIIAASGSFCQFAYAQEALQSNLREGGYVIYFRHGLASNEARPDVNLPSTVKECKGERHITEVGIKAIKTLRTQFKAAKIPVGKVVSSPACQALETSWYLLNVASEVESDLDGDPRAQIWVELRPFLTTVPPTGTNTVLFAHGTNIQALIGLAIAEGEAVIFKPDGKGGFNYVTRVKPEEWGSK